MPMTPPIAKMCYYAVSLSNESRQALLSNGGGDEPFNPMNFILPELGTTVQLCRTYPESRFKRFDSMKEALEFVDSPGACKAVGNAIPHIGETLFLFKAPSLDSFTSFKKQIECKNFYKVKELIDTNPLYLVSCQTDGPTILQQGCRQTAVHIAIRSGATDVLQYILQTLSKVDFIRRCYPNLDHDSLKGMQVRLLDYYLNMPEKASFNTPLHLACKQNCVESVRILLDFYPVIDINAVNAQHKSAQDLLTDNIEEIRSLFSKHRKEDSLLVECLKKMKISSN